MGDLKFQKWRSQIGPANHRGSSIFKSLPRILNLEQAIEFVRDDEYLEAIRMRIKTSRGIRGRGLG
jgi:predicted membrane GTPase involved in stress response